MEDLHKIWGHRWLSPKTEVKKSKLAGNGVFAKEKIKKGEIIRVTGGIIVPKSQKKDYENKLGYGFINIGLPVNEDFFICPTKDDLPKTATINHSCNPNSGFSDTVTVIAIRDIEPREEITLDYAIVNLPGEKFECNCKSPNCRKIIRPDDWKIPELQKKYGEYFSPYLKAKFKS